MSVIKNFGTINYSIGGETGQLDSNTILTNFNVSYSASIIKGATPEQFAPGEKIKYQVYLKNTGTGTFYNAKIHDNLGSTVSDKPLTYIDDTASAFLYNSDDNLVAAVDLAVIKELDNSITFVIPDPIPKGDYIVLTYHVLVNNNLLSSVTEIVNTVTFESNEGGTSGEEYTISTSNTISRKTVTIVKSASSDAVTPGDAFTYTFTLTNVGTTEVSISSLYDQLPANFIIDDEITVLIGDVVETYKKGTDYTVNNENYLTIAPDTMSVPLTIPAANGTAAGITTITIPGTISA